MATERKIGANVYRCEKLPASEGLETYFRVSRLFMAAPAMLASVAEGSADKKAKTALVTLALSDALDPKEAHALIVELAQLCRVGGDPCIVGVKPATMEELIEVAWFAMEVNFQSFLAASLADA